MNIRPSSSSSHDVATEEHQQKRKQIDPTISLTQRIQSLETIKQDLNIQNSILNVEKQNLIEELTAARIHAEQLHTNNVSLQAEVAVAKEHCEELEAALIELSKLNNDKTDTISVLQNTIQSQLEIINECRANNMTLQADIQRQYELNQQEMEELVSETTAHIATATKLNKNLRDAYHIQETQLMEARQSIEAAASRTGSQLLGNSIRWLPYVAAEVMTVHYLTSDGMKGHHLSVSNEIGELYERSRIFKSMYDYFMNEDTYPYIRDTAIRAAHNPTELDTDTIRLGRIAPPWGFLGIDTSRILQLPMSTSAMQYFIPVLVLKYVILRQIAILSARGVEGFSMLECQRMIQATSSNMYLPPECQADTSGYEYMTRTVLDVVVFTHGVYQYSGRSLLTEVVRDVFPRDDLQLDPWVMAIL